MIAKCNYCLTPFEAKRKTARFCSDLHRTLFGNLSEEEREKKLKWVANSKPVFSEPKSFSNGGTMLDEINTQNKKEAWVKEVEDFCNKEGITHKELIEGYKTKKVPKVKYSETNKEISDNSKIPYYETPRFKIVNGKKIFK